MLNGFSLVLECCKGMGLGLDVDDTILITLTSSQSCTGCSTMQFAKVPVVTLAVHRNPEAFASTMMPSVKWFTLFVTWIHTKTPLMPFSSYISHYLQMSELGTVYRCKARARCMT